MKMDRTNLFLNSSGKWEGLFSNFVNRDGGIEQEGKVVVQVDVTDEGVISHKNSFFRPDGTQSDYVGSLEVKVEGNNLVNLMAIEEDPNTKNKIENHRFEGYVTNKHIFIYETYEECYPDGKREFRRNSVHYYFKSKKEMIILADVYLDDKLLVIGNTKLIKIT